MMNRFFLSEAFVSHILCTVLHTLRFIKKEEATIEKFIFKCTLLSAAFINRNGHVGFSDYHDDK